MSAKDFMPVALVLPELLSLLPEPPELLSLLSLLLSVLLVLLSVLLSVLSVLSVLSLLALDTSTAAIKDNVAPTTVKKIAQYVQLVVGMAFGNDKGK